MAQYLKYEFTDSQYKTALAKITQTIEGPDGVTSEQYTDAVLAVVDLGKLVKTPAVLDEEGKEVTPAVYATKNSVDILWADQPLTTSFASYVVWPVPGVEAHVFGGWEADYAKAYCEANPDAAYCQPPAPVEL
jgi:hypothetical protein